MEMLRGHGKGGRPRARANRREASCERRETPKRKHVRVIWESRNGRGMAGGVRWARWYGGLRMRIGRWSWSHRRSRRKRGKVRGRERIEVFRTSRGSNQRCLLDSTNYSADVHNHAPPPTFTSPAPHSCHSPSRSSTQETHQTSSLLVGECSPEATYDASRTSAHQLKATPLP
jgi:hypothetical protein